MIVNVYLAQWNATGERKRKVYITYKHILLYVYISVYKLMTAIIITEDYYSRKAYMKYDAYIISYDYHPNIIVG